MLSQGVFTVITCLVGCFLYLHYIRFAELGLAWSTIEQMLRTSGVLSAGVNPPQSDRISTSVNFGWLLVVVAVFPAAVHALVVYFQSSISAFLKRKFLSPARARSQLGDLVMPTLTGKLVYGICTFVPNILHETLISPAAKGGGSLDSISSNMVYFCTFLVLQSNNIGLFGSLRSQKTQTAAFLVYAWGTGVFRLYQGFQADGCEYWGSTLYASFQYPIITLSLGILAVLPIRLLQEGLSPFLPNDPRWRFVLEFIVTYIFNSICIFLNVTLGLHLSSVLFRQPMAGVCPELSGSSIGLLFVGTLLLMVLLLAAIGMVIYTLMRARYVLRPQYTMPEVKYLDGVARAHPFMVQLKKLVQGVVSEEDDDSEMVEQVMQLLQRLEANQEMLQTIRQRVQLGIRFETTPDDASFSLEQASVEVFLTRRSTPRTLTNRNSHDSLVALFCVAKDWFFDALSRTASVCQNELYQCVLSVQLEDKITVKPDVVDRLLRPVFQAQVYTRAALQTLSFVLQRGLPSMLRAESGYDYGVTVMAKLHCANGLLAVDIPLVQLLFSSHKGPSTQTFQPPSQQRNKWLALVGTGQTRAMLQTAHTKFSETFGGESSNKTTRWLDTPPRQALWNRHQKLYRRIQDLTTEVKATPGTFVLIRFGYQLMRVWVVTDRLRQQGQSTAAAVRDTTAGDGDGAGAAEAAEEFDEENSQAASLALLDKTMLQLIKQTAFLSQIVFLQLAGRQQDRTDMSVVMTLCATAGIVLQMGLEYWTYEPEQLLEDEKPLDVTPQPPRYRPGRRRGADHVVVSSVSRPLPRRERPINVPGPPPGLGPQAPVHSDPNTSTELVVADAEADAEVEVDAEAEAEAEAEAGVAIGALLHVMEAIRLQNQRHHKMFAWMGAAATVHTEVQAVYTFFEDPEWRSRLESCSAEAANTIQDFVSAFIAFQLQSGIATKAAQIKRALEKWNADGRPAEAVDSLLQSLDQVLRWVAFGLEESRLRGHLPVDVDTEDLQIPRGLGSGVEALRAVHDTLTSKAHGLTNDELESRCQTMGEAIEYLIRANIDAMRAALENAEPKASSAHNLNSWSTTSTEWPGPILSELAAPAEASPAVNKAGGGAAPAEDEGDASA